MMSVIGRRRQTRSVSMLVLAALLAGIPGAAFGQDASADARLRKVEAEIQALQRKVFPGGDPRFFKPEITAGADKATTAQTATTTPVTDMLSRMDAMEAQLARLTGQAEENSNRLRVLEEKAGIASPAGAPAATPPAASPAPPAIATSTPAASSTPAATPAATPAPAPTIAATVAPAPSAPVAMAASTVPKAAPVAPPIPAAKPVAASSGRVEAVRAIVKPQSDDPGEDEYSYGFRLWEARFYPEAQQQLKIFIDKYGRHSRASWGRNLLGRAYLDDGQPREAAKWFLQNYQADKAGARAPDSLLFLVAAMKELKDTKRACIALAEFGEVYAAESAGRLRDLYDGTRKGLVCS